MREKVVPIPFLGKEVSSWLYRTTRWVREHPVKASGIILFCVGGSIVYEAQVVHSDRIVSPNVKNHLVYGLRKPSLWQRWTGAAAPAVEEGVALEDPDRKSLSPQELEAYHYHMESSRRTVTDAKRLILEETDPIKRRELQALIDKEAAIMAGGNDTTMLVRSGQLAVRGPHWDIRNNERNWSILSRDVQQQKDHYWYRYERSKDDDYARNTYTRP